MIALVLCAQATAHGQSTTQRLQVRDESGRAIPFAVVQLDGAERIVADELGLVAIRLRSGASPRLLVRRMGFRPHEGVLSSATSGDTTFVVLSRLSAQLDTVRVEARLQSPLAMTGFYARQQRAQRGAYTAEFITPEELDNGNASQVSEALIGRRLVRIQRVSAGRPRAVVLGRGGCPMTIVLDGVVMRNMLEALAARETPRSLNPRGSGDQADVRPGVAPGANLTSIDELTDGRAVMGIEVYASLANAPAELIPGGAIGGGCGLVAIWTGPRR